MLCYVLVCTVGCSVCLREPSINPVKMPCCQRIVCKACRDQVIQTSPYCAICQHRLQPAVGKQPIDATMSHSVSLFSSLPGYPDVGTIIITYHVPEGTQTREHPNPGRQYSSITRKAYLPDNDEGREVLQLLRRAFDARIIFTVAAMEVSRLRDAVMWSDIPHKTALRGL